MQAVILPPLVAVLVVVMAEARTHEVAVAVVHLHLSQPLALRQMIQFTPRLVPAVLADLRSMAMLAALAVTLGSTRQPTPLQPSPLMAL
jgi:hypothetical protein